MTKSQRGKKQAKRSERFVVEQIPKPAFLENMQRTPLPHEHCGGIKEPLEVRLAKAEKELRKNARKRLIRRAN